MGLKPSQLKSFQERKFDSRSEEKKMEGHREREPFVSQGERPGAVPQFSEAPALCIHGFWTSVLQNYGKIRVCC